MKKFCLDKKCERSGQKLWLSEFPRDRRSPDQRYGCCKECCRRRSRACRAAKGAREYRRKELGIERKPMKLAKPAFSLVYDAIVEGAKTREEIQQRTNLDFDSIGDALLELVYDCKAVRIQNREFVLSEQIAA